jgi:hypothetical protein
MTRTRRRLIQLFSMATIVVAGLGTQVKVARADTCVIDHQQASAPCACGGGAPSPCSIPGDQGSCGVTADGACCCIVPT